MAKYLINLVCIVGLAGAAHAGAVADLQITETGHAYLVFANGGLGQLTGYEIYDSEVFVVDGTPTIGFERPTVPENGAGEYATAWSSLASQGVPTGEVSGPLGEWFVEGDTVINAFLGEVIIEGHLAGVPGAPVYIGRILDTAALGGGGNITAADFLAGGRLANLQFASADTDEVVTPGTASLLVAAPLGNANEDITGASWKETGVVGAAGTDFDAVYVENVDGTGVVAVVDLKVVSSTVDVDTTTSILAGTVMVDGNVQAVTYADLVETVTAGDITSSLLRVKTIGPDGVISIYSTPTQTGSDVLGHFGTLASNMVVSLREGDLGGAPLATPDGTVNDADIDMMGAAVLGVSDDLLYDINADGAIDATDKDLLIHTLVDTGLGIASGTEYGDGDLDGVVGFGDFTRLAANYGVAGGWAVGDYNLDGTVGFGDFTTLAANYGKSAPAPAPGLAPGVVPEPATMTLLAIGGLALVKRRRRA